MKGLKGLLGSFMDDKGLFQGGEEGRVGGRFRDMLEGKSTSYDPSMEEDNELSVHARDFAKNMDVGNKEDVFEMQNMLNELGIKDFEGKSLKADAMMGDRTLSAMRMLQGEDFNEGESYGESVEPEQGSPWTGGDDTNTGRSLMNKLFGGGAGGDTFKARSKLFDRYGTGGFKRKGGSQGGAPSGPGPWSDGSGY